MAHNLMGDRFVGVKPAWHGLMRGEPLKATDRMGAILDAREMSVTIDKLPMVAQLPDGNFFAVPDRYILLRRPTADDSTYRNLGEVSADYSYMSDQQFADQVDMFMDSTGWHLDAMGYLGHGETIWAVMSGKSFTIAGEDYRHHYFVKDHRDGKRRFGMLATPVCAVCENTMRLAEKNNAAHVKVSHRNGHTNEVAWRMSFVADAIKRGDSMVSALRSLHKIQCDEEQFQKIACALFPMPTAPKSADLKASGVLELTERADRNESNYAWRCGQMEAARESVMEHFIHVNDTRPAIKDTALAGFQAVTGYLDHDAGKKNTPNQARVRAETTLGDKGDSIRTAAFELLSSLKGKRK